MIKKSAYLLFVFCLLFSGHARAQMFQNSNVACEVETLATQNAPQSITCKNYSAVADFDGNTFADCVAEDASWNTPGENNTAILLSQGAGVTCGSSPGQLSTALYAVDNSSGGTNEIATVAAGPLSPGALSSVLVPYVQLPANLAIDTPNASGVLPEAPNYVSSIFAGTQNGFASLTANRTSAVFDCNNDNYQDMVITGFNDSLSAADVIFMDVLENDQAASFNLSQVTVVEVTGGTAPAGEVAVGDFNADGDLDTAIVIDTKNGAIDAQVLVCTNDGACGFTCSQVINLQTEHPSFNFLLAPSIAAGDFNGDGLDDIVVALNDVLADFRGLDYYFNQSASPNTYSSPTSVSVTNTALSSPANIATGYFNNDAILDVAVTLAGAAPDSGSVQVLTSNGSGGINAPLALNFTADPVADVVDAAWGLDAADFDQQGCDDIVALATSANDRNAYVFMNTLETLEVNAGSDQSVLGSSVSLSGTCTLTPVDTTTTASSIVPTWTIVSGPSGATLTNANTLTPTLHVGTTGAYVVQLSCRSQCVSATTDTVSIQVDEILEGSGLHSCAFNPSAPFSWLNLVSLFSGLAFFWGLRRKV